MSSSRSASAAPATPGPVSAGGPGPPPGVNSSPAVIASRTASGSAGEPNYTCDRPRSATRAARFRLRTVTTRPANFPNDDSRQSGLHFIRGFSPATVAGNGPPEINNAYLTPSTCIGRVRNGLLRGTSRTSARRLRSGHRRRLVPKSTALVTVLIPRPAESRGRLRTSRSSTRSSTGTGNNDDIATSAICATCDLGDLAATGSSAWTARSCWSVGTQTRYAVEPASPARRTRSFPESCDNGSFGGSCEWYFRGIGRVNTQPTNAQFFNDPVQRAFRGQQHQCGSIMAPARAAKLNCPAPQASPLASTSGDPWVSAAWREAPSRGQCFVVESGLKGGIATDADDDPVLVERRRRLRANGVSGLHGRAGRRISSGRS